MLPTATSDNQLASGQTVLRTASVQGQSYRVLTTPWHDGGTLQLARGLTESNALLSRLRLELLRSSAQRRCSPPRSDGPSQPGPRDPSSGSADATENIATTLDLSSPMDVGGNR